jgi:hypothetical protein
MGLLDPYTLSQWTAKWTQLGRLTDQQLVAYYCVGEFEKGTFFYSSAQRLRRRCCRLDFLICLQLNDLKSMPYADTALTSTLHLLQLDSLTLRKSPSTADI